MGESQIYESFVLHEKSFLAAPEKFGEVPAEIFRLIYEFRLQHIGCTRQQRTIVQFHMNRLPRIHITFESVQAVPACR